MIPIILNSIQQQQQRKLYLHDYMKLQYCKMVKIKLQLILIIKRENKPIKKTMITMVNQVSSVRFDNKVLRKSLYNEINYTKCEF